MNVSIAATISDAIPGAGPLFPQRSQTSAAAIRQALAHDRFELAYQPILSPDGVFAHAAEALLRWTDPERHRYAAASIVPTLERSGAILEVEAWATEQACRQLALWRARYDPALLVHLNVAPLLLHVPGLAASLAATAAAAGLPCAAIELEVSEPVLVRASEAVVGRLCGLREAGFRIWADDFGSDLCSLSFLRKLSVCGVRFDRRHIALLAADGGDARFVADSVALARDYGLRVIAKNVEARKQLEILSGLGITRMQGFLLAAPMSGETFEREFLS